MANDKKTAEDKKGFHLSPVTYTLIIGLMFFLFGFGVATVLNNINAQNDTEKTQEMLDNAVATVVAEMPSVQEFAAAAGSGEPAEPERYPIDADDDPYLGAEDAPILIVEFSDFKCGYCGRFVNDTLNPLIEKYGDQIRFVYRDFPILTDISYKAALASECAHDQDKFWEYHDLIFENQSALDENMLFDFADQLELNTELFQTCLNEEVHRDEVSADFQAARDIGASGTPTFLVNGKKLVGAQPLNVFSQLIDEELALLTEGE